ncbi:hypothetical protein F0562_015559 [Nyssa sinensis]|uniref:Uncharacterized protein n=1 Tax=Nyssa sinensis TaxID=561372 RepID=A0A5J4ZHQ3_9ASTE|nr:hypothetical protein F0562_015559 [Nyssa sinensis]
MAESLQAPHFSPGSSLSHSDFRPASPEPSTALPIVARIPRAIAPLGSHPMLTRAKAGVFKPRHLAHLGLGLHQAEEEIIHFTEDGFCSSLFPTSMDVE